MEEVTSTLDGSKSVDIIYLNFAKAFDRVPYQRLLRKLNSHGIGRILFIMDIILIYRQKKESNIK